MDGFRRMGTGYGFRRMRADTLPDDLAGGGAMILARDDGCLGT
jgi:hypothetical protein